MLHHLIEALVDPLLAIRLGVFQFFADRGIAVVCPLELEPSKLGLDLETTGNCVLQPLSRILQLRFTRFTMVSELNKMTHRVRDADPGQQLLTLKFKQLRVPLPKSSELSQPRSQPTHHARALRGVSTEKSPQIEF